MSHSIQLKVGDKVELIRDCLYFSIGTILTIVELDNPDIGYPQSFRTEETKRFQFGTWWDKSHFTLGILRLANSSNILQNQVPTCQCGKDRHGFASHSQWCDKYSI